MPGMSPFPAGPERAQLGIKRGNGMTREIGQVRGIVFRLDDGWFFVDIMRVQEIIRPRELGTLVSMPTFVAGVLTLRGTVVPVLNLRERFDLPVRAAAGPRVPDTAAFSAWTEDRRTCRRSYRSPHPRCGRHTAAAAAHECAGYPLFHRGGRRPGASHLSRQH